MKQFKMITAISLLFMGFNILTEEMPVIFLQHLLGLLFIFVAILIWRMK